MATTVDPWSKKSTTKEAEVQTSGQRNRKQPSDGKQTMRQELKEVLLKIK
jgi:hypothetical protein